MATAAMHHTSLDSSGRTRARWGMGSVSSGSGSGTTHGERPATDQSQAAADRPSPMKYTSAAARATMLHAAAPVQPRQHARREAAEPTRDFHSVHVYGSKAALCFSADDTRGGAFTVRVEGAASQGQRQYDWTSKISLQFTVKELPKLLCVLLGVLDRAEFSSHGPAKDKAISIENQAGGKVFASLRQGRVARAVPITPEDMFGIVDLVVKRMRMNSPHLSAEAVLSLTRALARRFAQA